jgi:hypothetical protein
MKVSVTAPLVASLLDAVKWLEANGVHPGFLLLVDVYRAAKTYAHYDRVLRSGVRDLYNGDITESDFVTILQDLIPQQLTRAWHEGMAENGLEPDEMIPEWEDQLQAMILSEYDYVDGFAADIAAAAQSDLVLGDSLDGLMSRADLWANRYTDVVNEAKLRTADGKDKFVWNMGATEEHCWICSALNGIVAFAKEWEQSGFRPQEPPNELLSMERGGEKGCKGWRCDCTLNSTTDRRTNGALDKLLALAVGQNV